MFWCGEYNSGKKGLFLKMMKKNQIESIPFQTFYIQKYTISAVPKSTFFLQSRFSSIECEQSIKMWGFHEHIHRTSFTIWLGGHIYNSFLTESKLLKLGIRISSTKIIAVSVTKVFKTHTDSPAHADVPNSTKCSIMSTKEYTTNPLKFFSLIFRIPTE